MRRPSFGLRPLDDLIGGLRIGDNLVLESSSGEVSVDGFVSAFVRQSRGANRLAYLSFHVPPHVVLDRLSGVWDAERHLLVDCYTDGLGGSESAFVRFYRTKLARDFDVLRVEDVADPISVRARMSALEHKLGPNTRYVFDSLTGVQEIWGADEALAFFLRSCPRLYELRTVALWLLDRSMHDGAFLSRLARVTQVILQVEAEGDGYALRVAKADGRPADVTGRGAKIRFEGDRARLVREVEPGTKERIGARIREHRRARGLSQAALARRIGVSPSALSQAERGTAGLSGATLTRMWSELGIPTGEERVDSPTLRVNRRGGHAVERIAPGLDAEEIAHLPGKTTVSLLRFGAGQAGNRAPFATKQDEVVVVIGGVLELRVGEQKEILHAGDAAVISTEVVSAWRNPGPEETVVLWSRLP
jgi:transcriptional regulator with XRE-family HTH domain